MENRISELKAVAVEEQIEFNRESETSLRYFSEAFGEPLAVFLLDNGNLRARWKSTALITSIEFKGAGRMELTHLPL